MTALRIPKLVHRQYMHFWHLKIPIHSRALKKPCCSDWGKTRQRVTRRFGSQPFSFDNQIPFFFISFFQVLSETELTFYPFPPSNKIQNLIGTHYNESL